MQYPKL
jgi:hypothetical protein